MDLPCYDEFMCGRGRKDLTWRDLAALYRAQYKPDLSHRYEDPQLEIRPTETMTVLRASGESRTLSPMRWGLVPSFADGLKVGSKMFNARVETAPMKPSFRKAWRNRRCLVLLDGFYEWSGEGKARHPNLVHLENDGPLPMAGLWESWVDKATGEVVESCTILTREAAGPLSTIHDRMPIILRDDVLDAWLDPTSETFATALESYVSDELLIEPIARIGPAPIPVQGTLF